jgi:BCD family chlorophyll transporter-like MFS transporter
MFLKRFQLGLVHLAVAMTLVPINSTLNRVMINELAISATLVAVLASLPYVFSPIQVLIGSFSDRYPVLGWRRSPYILAGLLLCVLGVVVSPLAAYSMAATYWVGLSIGLLAFGAWGMGYNLAAVSYLSLASELSGEKGRARTVATMWFMMIVGIIFTAVLLSRLVDPYTPQALQQSFLIVGMLAMLLGGLGLLKLERRHSAGEAVDQAQFSWRLAFGAVRENQQASLFFIYLVILLAALLGQDILLEPFGAQAFGLAVRETTRITAIWGSLTLAALLIGGALDRRVEKRSMAAWGGWTALAGFILIVLSGLIPEERVFYLGVALLGFGTGLSTVSNLSLMLDMTTAGKVGIFIGAWGMANAVSRLIGSVLGGALRDLLTSLLPDPSLAYVAVFAILAILLLGSLLMLNRINVQAFRESAEERSLIERASLASEIP